MNTRLPFVATQPAIPSGDPSAEPSAIPNPNSTIGLTMVNLPVAVIIMPNAKHPLGTNDFDSFIFTQVREEIPARFVAFVADDPLLVGIAGPTTEET